MRWTSYTTSSASGGNSTSNDFDDMTRSTDEWVMLRYGPKDPFAYQRWVPKTVVVRSDGPDCAPPPPKPEPGSGPEFGKPVAVRRAKAV